MSYYTRYTFSVHDYGKNPPSNKNIAEYIKQAYKNSGEDAKFYPLMERASLGEELTDYLNDESSKGMIIESFDGYDWENNDIDMLELSEIFPGVIFKLHGEGENPEDI